MRNLKNIIITVSILLLTCSTKAQKIDTLLSHIFFNVDLSVADTNIVSLFENKPELKRIDYGWIAYPPQSNKTDTPHLSIYDYQTNAFFPNSFDSGGSITVVLIKTNKGKFLDNIGLKTSTLNLISGDSIYNYLNKFLSKHSAKKWNEKGLDGAHTVTYFRDKNKKVTLTKYKSTYDPKAAFRISVTVKYLKTM